MMHMLKTILVAAVLIPYITLTYASIDDLVQDARTGEIAPYSELAEEYKNAMKEKCEGLAELDGCSAPFGDHSFLYRGYFTPACLRHDFCYRCAQTYNWKQRACDNAFHRDMVQLCTAVQQKRWFFTGETKCNIAAGSFYYAVLYFGGQYHGVDSKKWCELPCAKNSGDPAYTKEAGQTMEDLVDWEALEVDKSVEDKEI
uniref:Toxin candidate TRINITY_DN2382_c0_g1_i1 n=1 Tax=Pachycerianthus borealis TaxID=2736680 RepID=A0A7G7WZ17_9CNID|nr:toxin candidate TRINITY_DN2382_c0_g1_i1 [Pachycerianthus borealis]